MCICAYVWMCVGIVCVCVCGCVCVLVFCVCNVGVMLMWVFSYLCLWANVWADKFLFMFVLSIPILVCGCNNEVPVYACCCSWDSTIKDSPRAEVRFSPTGFLARVTPLSAGR